ncbi:alpha/beta fold hydrolase [Paenibacillus daejeonensis]|uniref:alpha/beta fold hydrolase n=1 Tax=Paenibacillus daejeonensis TaxID=135193 RepID=UPI00037A22E5|nr:alpha/beta hydrolase [Paenibacillus daejeonensis]
MEHQDKQNKKNSGKRKGLRLIWRGLIGLTVVAVLFVAVVFTVNRVSLHLEKDNIRSYGQLVPVDGQSMNIYMQGSGEETIVLLPGYGTAAPALDFKLLIDELAPDYRVITVEPFGYGLSDGTDVERTSSNIVREIHEALQQLGIDDFVLMGHSIAGIYSLEYVQAYPENVRAFIGIDSSVPNQPGMNEKLPVRTFDLLNRSGLLRLVKQFSGDPYASTSFDEATKEQMNLISNKNASSPTMLNEMRHISTNFEAAQGLTFPAQLPVLLMVQADNSSFPEWVPLHEEQAATVDNGQVITMDGEHYLHHTHAQEIAEATRVFLLQMQQK